MPPSFIAANYNQLYEIIYVISLKYGNNSVYHNILDFCGMLYKIGFIIYVNGIESIQITEQMTNRLLE